MKPTIGRIVRFIQVGGTVVPAIVVGTSADSDELTLCVFTHTGPINYLGVQPGADDLTWHWPPQPA